MFDFNDASTLCRWKLDDRKQLAKQLKIFLRGNTRAIRRNLNQGALPIAGKFSVLYNIFESYKDTKSTFSAETFSALQMLFKSSLFYVTISYAVFGD